VLAHRNRAPVDDLLSRGAREAKTPAALARASDIVILCVPINNFLSPGITALFAEAVATATKADVDLATLFEVVSAGGAKGKSDKG
jgi:3-hydroxyisobutyrate dehydrogenase-like beta-hydroxyacid dehydrogenase